MNDDVKNDNDNSVNTPVNNTPQLPILDSIRRIPHLNLHRRIPSASPLPISRCNSVSSTDSNGSTNSEKLRKLDIVLNDKNEVEIVEVIEDTIDNYVEEVAKKAKKKAKSCFGNAFKSCTCISVTKN